MYHSFQVVTQPSLGFKAGEKVCLLGCPMAEAAAALGAPDRTEKAPASGGGGLHRYLVDGAELREDASGRLAGARFLPRGGEAGGEKLGKADLLTPGGELMRGARPADIKAAYGEPAHTASAAEGPVLAYVLGGDVLYFDFRGWELDAVRLEAGGLNVLKELLARQPAVPAQAAPHPGARAADTTLAEKLTVTVLVMLVAFGLFQGIVRGIFSLIMRGNSENGVYILFYGGGIVMLVAALIGGAAALLFWRRARRRGAGAGEGPWSALGSGLTMGLAVVAGVALLMLALFAWTFKAV